MKTQDIYTALREMCHMHHTKEDSDRLACFYCDSADEIERLRAALALASSALALAVGELSTNHKYRMWNAEMLLNQFLEEARRG